MCTAAQQLLLVVLAIFELPLQSYGPLLNNIVGELLTNIGRTLLTNIVGSLFLC